MYDISCVVLQEYSVPRGIMTTIIAASVSGYIFLISLLFALPLFLALACVLGIAATGSVFELAYGDPDLGVATTRWILGLALPGTLLSLLVAIRINKPA